MSALAAESRGVGRAGDARARLVRTAARAALRGGAGAPRRPRATRAHSRRSTRRARLSSRS
ncbi:MAG: hypothetical protein MZV70_42900 [Desulfobacterales bacterium]|nr:hypothetical protein [Desulfobacterales bacterium]